MKLLHLLLIFCLGVAVIFAFLVDLIDPKSENSHKNEYDIDNDPVQIDDQYKNIFWFVQISDFHISKFNGRNRGPDLVQFCRDYLSVIRPDIVLATGDLVDAKDASGTGQSEQYMEEWEEYHQLLRDCSLYHQARWLDVRGNHDSFNVPNLQSQKNLYRQYSSQGLEHITSYTYTHNTPYGKYSFIAVDACPDPGPKRPFNFFGQLNEDRIEELGRYAQETRGSNLTVWFGHYPTSLIMHDPPGLKHVMRSGIAYLCGHLHTLNGNIPQMYTRHKTGTLELELGDWKDNRIFRLMVVDHDILSFVDLSLGDWPLIVITNPKHATFQSETHEPLHRARQSTHIRLLIFHKTDIESVSVYIDGQYKGDARQVQGALYVYHWDPSSYSSGIHSIRVTVKDIDGEQKDVHQPFSLDGSRPPFHLVPRLVLMMNLGTVGKVMFVTMVFVYILFLGFLHQCPNIRTFLLSGETMIHYYINRWLWKLWLTARTDCIYYPVLGAALYVTFGPWFVGDFLDNQPGILFVWGLYINGSFLPGSHSYFYGLYHMLTFHIPLLFHLSHSLDVLYFTSRMLQEVKVRQITRFKRITHSYLPFAFLLLQQIYVTFTEFPRAYGVKAITLGPVRTGSLLLLVYLQYMLHHVPLRRSNAMNGNITTPNSS